MNEVCLPTFDSRNDFCWGCDDDDDDNDEQQTVIHGIYYKSPIQLASNDRVALDDSQVILIVYERISFNSISLSLSLAVSLHVKKPE